MIGDHSYMAYVEKQKAETAQKKESSGAIYQEPICEPYTGTDSLGNDYGVLLVIIPETKGKETKWIQTVHGNDFDGPCVDPCDRTWDDPFYRSHDSAYNNKGYFEDQQTSLLSDCLRVGTISRFSTVTEVMVGPNNTLTVTQAYSYGYTYFGSITPDCLRPATQEELNVHMGIVETQFPTYHFVK
jgi:hypothetical protein